MFGLDSLGGVDRLGKMALFNVPTAVCCYIYKLCTSTVECHHE